MKDYRQYEPIFGVWHITKLLGEGSLGKVFEMESERCGTVAKAALKVIPLLPDRDNAGGQNIHYTWPASWRAEDVLRLCRLLAA